MTISLGKMIALFVFILSGSVQAQIKSETFLEPDWQEGFTLPPNGRARPYAMTEEQFIQYRDRGQVHTQIYPVRVTGALPPYEPFRRIIEADDQNLFRNWLNKLFKRLIGFRSFNDVMTWMGLHDYPLENETGIYRIAYPDNRRPTYKMGFSLVQRGSAQGFTFSCAACHSESLFGKTILGLTNRFPRANEVFLKGKMGTLLIQPTLFRAYTHATADEVEMLKTLQRNLKSIGIKRPLMLGLDTSLAQVALSLNRRNPDEVASRNSYYESHPRADLLDDFPADSKPAVWWNLKYKNRWLSDGSVISGNPIFTNILWNEIGRGADLVQLEEWFVQNKKTIQELTTAVFSTEAPSITDFFSESQIDLTRAKSGEIIFRENCAKCHGTYIKKWSEPGAELLPLREQIRTTEVRYKKNTPVVNVGTDPNRYLGLKSLEKINQLRISKNNGILLKSQKGYVPPPLVGIWARWPYFHNNSIPNLCVLLTAGKNRPISFYQGAAQNPKTDFDFACNGYPLGESVPQHWRHRSQLYQTTREGMRNFGHDEGIILKEGKEILSPAEKQDLISFLQTL